MSEPNYMAEWESSHESHVSNKEEWANEGGCPFCWMELKNSEMLKVKESQAIVRSIKSWFQIA